MKNFFVLLAIVAVCCFIFCSPADAAVRRAGGRAACQGGSCQVPTEQAVPPVLVEKAVIKTQEKTVIKTQEKTVIQTKPSATESPRRPVKKALSVPMKMGRRIGGAVLRGGGGVVKRIFGRRQ